MGLSSTHPGYHHLPVREICLDNYNCCRHQHEATYIPLLNNWSKEDKDRDKSNLYSWSDFAFVSCSPVAAVLLHLQLGPSGWRCWLDNLFSHFLILLLFYTCRWAVGLRLVNRVIYLIYFLESWFGRSILPLIISSFRILLLSTTCCSPFWCKAVAAVSRHSTQQRHWRCWQSWSTLRMLPQQHGHLHPIDLRLVSSTRDPNNSASSTRVQVPEEISTLVPTNPLGEVQSSHWSDWR